MSSYPVHEAIEAVPELENNTGLCTVNCYSQITGEDFGTSAYMLTEVAKALGYGLPGKGMTVQQHLTVMRNLGMQLLELVPREWRAYGKTIRTFARNAPKEHKFVVYCSNGRHVLPVVNGEVKDWSDGRLHRIYRVYRVRRID